MADSDRLQVLAYLQAHQVMTLATVGEGGIWATAVFYTNDAFNLYFLSAGHTRHAQNFAYQPHIAATIQEDYRDWPTIQGVQLEGHVQQLENVSRETAVALYTQKFPFLANPQIAAALTKINWYQLTPTRLYFIDNTKGFGHRVEIALNIK